MVQLLGFHYFILLRLTPLDRSVDREGWWFEHCVLWLQVRLSANGAKNVSWPWLTPLQEWDSPTTCLLLNLYLYSSLLQLAKAQFPGP